MPPIRMMPLLLLSSLAFLTACGETRTVKEVETVKATAPEPLLTCADAPAMWGLGATQRDVSVYVLRLQDAHADCKAKLNEVKAWGERQ